LSHSTSTFLYFFNIGSHELLCLGWLWTGILLISASWVARIAGMSHWRPAVITVLQLPCPLNTTEVTVCGYWG
jgi:hypothetical protein